MELYRQDFGASFIISMIVTIGIPAYQEYKQRKRDLETDRRLAEIKGALEKKGQLASISYEGPALHRAAFYGQVKKMEELLKAGADLTEKDKSGSTAIDIASEQKEIFARATLFGPEASREYAGKKIKDYERIEQMLRARAQEGMLR